MTPLTILLTELTVLTLILLITTAHFLLTPWRARTALRRDNAANRAALLRLMHQPPSTRLVGFFHPYAAAFGGGERVLYAALATVLAEPHTACVIYAADADEAGKAILLARVRERFALALDSRRVAIVHVAHGALLSPAAWPFATLAGQSAGSARIVFAALRTSAAPDIFIDTLGAAFTYPVVRFLAPSTRICSYTHYPTVSAAMLGRVRARTPAFNNAARFARSGALARSKALYYRAFAAAYAGALANADVLMANSTWTAGHIRDLVPARAVHVVFPPCDTGAFAALDTDAPRGDVVLSLAQFRPEKAHEVQLMAFKLLLEKQAKPPNSGGASEPEPRTRSSNKRNRLAKATKRITHNVKSKHGAPAQLSSPEPDDDRTDSDTTSGGALSTPRLILAGSVRNADDKARVASLKALARELAIEKHVTFAVNLPFKELVTLAGTASIGIHTMVDEHFGITLVEFMAAGLIVLAHASAGPLLDIVQPGTGFLATSVEDFADQLAHIRALSVQEQHAIRQSARASVATRFSTDTFDAQFKRCVFEEVRTTEEARKTR